MMTDGSRPVRFVVTRKEGWRIAGDEKVEWIAITRLLPRRPRASNGGEEG